MKKTIMHNITKTLMILVSVLTLMSCDRSFIYEYEGDCSVTYRLHFRYDLNMKWADAFPVEVKSVRVYIFDEDERLIKTIVESGDALAASDYALILPLPPGTYHLVSWCGADNNPNDECFDIVPDPTKGNVPTLDDVRCSLKAKTDSNSGTLYSDRLLHPLFHGEMLLVLEDYSMDGGTYDYTMSLTKDTNDIRVVLQQLSGDSIDVNDFNFTIRDDNSVMDHSNSLIPGGGIEYRSWHTDSVEAGVEIKDPITGITTSSVSSVALAELSVSRLLYDHHNSSFLEISRKSDNYIVAKIPLIDYAVLVKGYERTDLNNQEYLDRQDEYSFTFFLDATGKWISSTILINSWRVILQEENLH